MFYIGNTQQKHVSEIRAMIERSEKSDSSFASQYASHFTMGTRVTPGEIREIMIFRVLWRGCLSDKLWENIWKAKLFVVHERKDQAYMSTMV